MQYLKIIAIAVVTTLSGCSTVSWHQQLNAIMRTEPEPQAFDLADTTTISSQPNEHLHRAIKKPSSLRLKDKRKPQKSARKTVRYSVNTMPFEKPDKSKKLVDFDGKPVNLAVPQTRLYSVERGWFKRPLNVGKDIRTRKAFGETLRLQRAPYGRNQ